MYCVIVLTPPRLFTMIFAKGLATAILFPLASATNYPAGKRGIGTDDEIDTSGFEYSKVRWQYNWGSDIYNNKVSFAEYVPVLWSGDAQLVDWWHTNVPTWLNRGTGHLMAFNEPEGIPGQANMAVDEAVNAWRAHMEPYHGRALLGAPAVSNAGWDWITQFLSQCQGCHIDFIPIHWYNPHPMEWDFENWVNRVCGLGKLVWVTEVRSYRPPRPFKLGSMPTIDRSLGEMMQMTRIKKYFSLKL